MGAGEVTRWARRFVATSIVFLVVWQVGAVVAVLPRIGAVLPQAGVEAAPLPRETLVSLALYGFVLHTVFGKAYSLVPAYFDRSLGHPLAPAVHLPLTALGAVGLAAEPLSGVPEVVGDLGALFWAAGVAVFVVALGWTLRDNPLGRETGTSEANAHRKQVDQFANAFVPVVIGYLLVGTYGTVSGVRVFPDSLPILAFAQTAHLLAAGTAALLIFAVGFRLFPRFLVASPPRTLVAVVLPAGALGPAILASGLYRGWWFRVGALLQAIAVVGFALAYAALFVRSERRRVGFYSVLAGVTAGVFGVLVGLHFAFSGVTTMFGGVTAALVSVHFRLNVLGFLGLTIVGASYQFYPPTVGTFPGASDRTALASVVLVGLGLLAELGGALAGSKIAVADSGILVVFGRTSALAGAVAVAWLVLGVFRER